MKKTILMFGFVLAAVVAAPKSARADECLEVGWRDAGGSWVHYRAWVESESGHHITMRYDYHHGRLEMKIHEKEKADGRDVIVMRGRWIEHHEGRERTGLAHFELERGHHRAKGWYTQGLDEDATRYEFVLRDCRR